jgi:serine/threonine protein kinase
MTTADADLDTHDDPTRFAVFRQASHAQLEEFPGEYLTSGFPYVSVGDVLSHYRIVRKLGHGAYSTVWLAEDVRYPCNCYLGLIN